MRTQHRADAHAVFQRTLEQVADQVAVELSPVNGAGGLERVVHKYDLLPFEFLEGAVATGAAVARLTVTRHENGVEAMMPGSTTPARFGGTGWLISPDHLFTNHHVIAARSESEAPPSPDDLTRQALTMRVEFDVDRVEARVDPIAVRSLVTSDPALDYAIVQLSDPGGRRPLPLAGAEAIVAAADAQSPVNIVQHPGGAAKEIGLRNNLIASKDEKDLRYFTDTLAGSSGSPVCTDDWRVVALHKGWMRVSRNIEFQGKSVAWVNRGTRIDVIAAHLQEHEPDMWATVGR
jgi:V8-like Glu-specific endopeptidase